MKTFSKLAIAVVTLLLAVFIGYSIQSNQNRFTHSEGVFPDVTYENEQTLKFAADISHVRHLGRTVFQDGVCWASMSGSGVEFDCMGEYVKFTLLCEDAESLRNNHRPRIAVFADGELVIDTVLNSSSETFTVDLEEYSFNAVIKIIKLSESMYSSFGVGEIETYGKRDIKPTQKKELSIEFIGDSLTAGFGVDETRTNADFSTATEDFTKTYAYLTAKELDANYSAVAFSGYGVLSGYTKSHLNSEDTIFSVYEKAITNKKFEMQAALDTWYGEESNDIVVINLGTNDASYCVNGERRKAFTEKYEELLSLVRKYNSDAFIICALGDVNNSMYPYIKQAVENFRQRESDLKITCTVLNYNMAENGSVIQGHPSFAAHQAAAAELTALIENILSPSFDFENEDFTSRESDELQVETDLTDLTVEDSENIQEEAETQETNETQKEPQETNE